MKVLILDTETSSLPAWGLPSEHPDQPHLCQFTALLFDDRSGEELEYVDLIIRQEWPVDPKAFAVHGITPERSMEEGEPEHHAMQFFEAMEPLADRIVGFSLAFDLRLMRIAMLRTGRAKGYCDLVQQRIKHRAYDVMPFCAPLCKIPPTDKMMGTGRKTWKSPKLEEAVEILLGEKMHAAHDARGDVLYTKRLYEFLQRRTTP